MSIHLSDVHFRASFKEPPPPPPPPPPVIDDVFVSFAVAFEQEALDEWAAGFHGIGPSLLEVLEEAAGVDTQGVFIQTDDFLAAGQLYGWAQHSRLATIDKASGTTSYFSANPGPTAGGALASRSSDDAFYAVNDAKLYSVSTTDGTATFIANVSSTGVVAAASFGPGDVLYGVDVLGAPRNLITIDLVTGAATTIGAMTNNTDALAWSLDGLTLYAALGSSATASDLYTVNPATGAMTSIGAIGFALTGLAFDPTSGTLYGVTSTNSTNHPRGLVTVNPGTGAGTFVGALTGVNLPISDIAFTTLSSGGTGFWTDYGNEDTFAAPLEAETWYTVDLHIQPAADHEARVDGVVYALPDSFGNGGQGTATQRFEFGNQFFTTVAASFLYIDDVRIGTSAYSSNEFFSDDFESETLATWSATQGTPTFVDDPFGGGRGKVLRFATDEFPDAYVAWETD